MIREPHEQQVYDLYDDYCHGRIERRDFFSRSAALTVGGVSALALAESLMPRYAEAMTVSFTDERIKATWVNYDSPGGNSGSMRGYLVRPTGGEGPFPSILVIHENRGLNPYVKNVARRAAAAGFWPWRPTVCPPWAATRATMTTAAPCSAVSTATNCARTSSMAHAGSRATNCPQASSAPLASAGAAARRTISP